MMVYLCNYIYVWMLKYTSLPFFLFVFVSLLCLPFCNDHQKLVWADMETLGDHQDNEDVVV